MQKNLMTPREDTWGFMNLQNCILQIAKYVDTICEQNSIQYCLMGGSALGAIRHKGFIPWDDDLDIFMTPDNFEKFRECHLKNGDTENFYLQEWGGKDGLVSTAKVRMNHSTYIEKDLEHWDINQGVFMDIFILHTCPDNKFKRYWQYFWAKYLVTKGAANRGYNKKGGLVGFLVKTISLFPKRFMVNYAMKQLYRFRNEKSEYLCHFMGRALLKKGLYKRTYFETMKRVPFESTTLCVPGRCEEYLRDRWGDYMKLPSIEEIKKYQHCWKWSDSETFPGYKEDNDYKEEIYLLA